MTTTSSFPAVYYNNSLCLASFGWFHGAIGRNDGETLLLHAAAAQSQPAQSTTKNGLFLVRFSVSGPVHSYAIQYTIAQPSTQSGVRVAGFLVRSDVPMS